MVIGLATLGLRPPDWQSTFTATEPSALAKAEVTTVTGVQSTGPFTVTVAGALGGLPALIARTA